MTQYSLATIDVGNTNISIGYFSGVDLVKIDSRKTNYLNNKFKLMSSDKIIISSVVPKVADALLAKYPLAKVISHSDIPINFDDNVGIDRAINCYAAQKIYQTKNVLVVDFGTALTFTCCTHQEFRGGLIMAGYGLAKKSLSHHTAMLPGVDGIGDLDIFQKETGPAILSGVSNFYKQAVSGLIARYRAEVDDDLLVVFTGGDSLFLADLVSEYNIVNPTLLLEGLALLAK